MDLSNYTIEQLQELAKEITIEIFIRSRNYSHPEQAQQNHRSISPPRDEQKDFLNRTL